ncbi:ADP-ribosylation factor-like protein 5B isoform X2 [Crocuta crocuta]
MGLIFAKLWSLFCNQEHKVIIVGLDNAGKTTILYQFLMNEVVHTSPTIGSNVEEIVVKNTHFLMWDIGGQESLRSSWNTYYSNTEFIILVVDSIDRERLAITKEELYRMLAHEKECTCAQKRQREREGDRESQESKPDTGLELTNCKIMT